MAQRMAERAKWVSLFGSDSVGTGTVLVLLWDEELNLGPFPRILDEVPALSDPDGF